MEKENDINFILLNISIIVLGIWCFTGMAMLAEFIKLSDGYMVLWALSGGAASFTGVYSVGKPY